MKYFNFEYLFFYGETKTGYTFRAGYTLCAHCICTIFICALILQFQQMCPSSYGICVILICAFRLQFRQTCSSTYSSTCSMFMCLFRLQFHRTYPSIYGIYSIFMCALRIAVSAKLSVHL
jgi:hypothetical protein